MQENRFKILQLLSYPRLLLVCAFANADTQKQTEINPNFFSQGKRNAGMTVLLCGSLYPGEYRQVDHVRTWKHQFFTFRIIFLCFGGKERSISRTQPPREDRIVSLCGGASDQL